jgi:hypothetical protein
MKYRIVATTAAKKAITKQVGLLSQKLRKKTTNNPPITRSKKPNNLEPGGPENLDIHGHSIGFLIQDEEK